MGYQYEIKLRVGHERSGRQTENICYREITYFISESGADLRLFIALIRTLDHGESAGVELSKWE